MKNEAILAIDPGRDKIGLAVADPSGQVLEHEWIFSRDFEMCLRKLNARYRIKEIILGDKTYSGALLKRIRTMEPLLPVYGVDEAFSTQEARQLYWIYHSPKGWKEFFFRLLGVPSGPWDDLTAIVLLRRYINKAAACAPKEMK